MGGSSLARVVIADRSRSMPSRDVRDSPSSRAHSQPATRLVLFDSAAAIEPLSGAADSLRRRSLRRPRARVALGRARRRAQRCARSSRARADSIELAIISPLASDELDAASAVDDRSIWPGRSARLVRTAAALPAAVRQHHARERSTPDDECFVRLVAVASRWPPRRGRCAVRTGSRCSGSRWCAVRFPTADTAAARRWPPPSSRGRAFGSRGRPPSAQGVWAGGSAHARGAARTHRYPGRRPHSRAMGRWRNRGRRKRVAGRARMCARDRRRTAERRRSLTLQPAFVSVVARALFAPCGGSVGAPALSGLGRAVFARSGSAATAAALPHDR